MAGKECFGDFFVGGSGEGGTGFLVEGLEISGVRKARKGKRKAYRLRVIFLCRGRMSLADVD